MATRRTRLEGWPIVFVAAVALLAMCALVLIAYGTQEAGARAVIRSTARSSLVLFLAAFVASSARRLWKSEATAWLLRNRRQIGVSFAASHGLHLAGIVALATQSSESFWSQTSAVTLYGGGLGFLFVAALAATSSDAAVRWLGQPRWKLLHRVGVWYLFGIFLLSYGPAFLVKPSYLPASLGVFTALGLRVAAWRRGRDQLSCSPLP